MDTQFRDEDQKVSNQSSKAGCELAPRYKKPILVTEDSTVRRVEFRNVFTMERPFRLQKPVRGGTAGGIGSVPRTEERGVA